MKIISRNGQQEHLDLTKIVNRIKKACGYCGKELSVDPDLVAIKVIENIRDNITTSELDDITAKICINLSMENPEYGLLGSRIAISNHQKNVKVSFSEAMENLYNNNGKKDAKLISDQLIETIRKNKEYLDKIVEEFRENDFLIDFFGFKTLERSYLLKDSNNKIWETPQYLWMRVALGIWGDNISKVINTYKFLSNKNGTHATPTLFNSGTPRPSMSSCFLLGTDDSIDGIYETISDCAKISKWAGGIGVHISNVRPKGSYIKGTGGKTDGIIPMMKVYNATARYVNQCFTPETVIYTNNGAKEIKDIRPVIDKVMTSDGTFRQVNQVITNEIDKEILHITCKNNSNGSLKCTDVHEIMIYRPKENTIDIERKFISAREIEKGDFMCFPVPKSVSKEETNMLSFEQIDKLITNFRTYGTYTDKFATLDDQSLREVLEVILEENIRDLECEQQDNRQMKDAPLKVYNLNKKSYDNLRYLFIRLGQLTRGHKLPGTLGPSGSAYETNLPKNEFIKQLTGSRVDKDCGFFEKDGWLYTPVVDIQKEHYKGTVYDLNVQDNHDYLTENGLVHNSGKRNGSIACYLEPWHGDIFEFLAAMRNHGHEETLARDLFYSLWIPDLFMKQVKSGGYWYLMDNNQNEKLTDLYGGEFENYYCHCVSQGKYIKKIKAQDLWNEILKSQQESGMPYICYKDHMNRKSNQKNIGTIKSSNLCAEIAEYSDSTSTAVCNLGSIRLQSHLKKVKPDNILTVYTKDSCPWCDLVKVFLKEQEIEFTLVNIPETEKLEFFKKYDNQFSTFPQVFEADVRLGGFIDTVRRFRPQIDYFKLRKHVHTLAENIDRIIDINHYPTEKAKRNNLAYRPMGIGVQGLADMFAKMWIPYESDDALVVNKQIFEAIYYYAIEKSVELSKRSEKYSAFDGSPLSRGQFQFDLWGVTPTDKFDWEWLRLKVMKYGVKNSLMIALMPTASTAQILGSTESFEPYNSCMYLRRTLSGEFLVINQSLINKLIKLNLWDNTMKQRIMFHRGSIQKIKSIPTYIKELYKTVWEIKKKHYLKMSADRGAYVCQSQSLNIYVEANNNMTQMLSNIHMYGWSLGLKTGSYYIRTRPATNPQSFTIDPNMEDKFKQELESQKVQECLNCGA